MAKLVRWLRAAVRRAADGCCGCRCEACHQDLGAGWSVRAVPYYPEGAGAAGRRDMDVLVGPAGEPVAFRDAGVKAEPDAGPHAPSPAWLAANWKWAR